MRFNRNFRGRGINAQRTTAQRAIAFLRALGTSAHVWLPGANGVSVASLPSNNYLLSDGSTGYSTVDGVVGLTLDGMGALSSTNLVTNGTFDTVTTDWTGVAGGVPSVVSGEMLITAGTATNGGAYQAITTVVGKTYSVTFTYRKGTADSARFYVGYSAGSNEYINIATISATAVTLTVYFTALLTTTYVACVSFGAVIGYTAYFDNISVKEYTGTRLTQATTANKPLVRRGMLNELLNSATPATQSVTCIAAPYTLALIGTGNVVLSGTGAGTLTGTGASDLVVLNFTPTAGSVTFTKAGTVSSFGLFKGTWTAAQILAEGGIPTTTATAASNPSAGKYWWSFDGSNDSLLSGNLGITNACTITIAGVVNTLGGYQMLLAEASNGVLVYVGPTGTLSFGKQGVSDLVSSAGAIVAGVPFVITARLGGGTAVVRKNGLQLATAVSALTFSATTGARIGTDLAGTSYPLNGALGWVVPIAAALSDADCLTVERLVSSQFPNGPVF